MLPIEDMLFKVILGEFRVEVNMYSPESAAPLARCVKESFFRKPTRFAVRSAMRSAYRNYSTREDLIDGSGYLRY